MARAGRVVSSPSVIHYDEVRAASCAVPTEINGPLYRNCLVNLLDVRGYYLSDLRSHTVSDFRATEQLLVFE